MKRKESTSVDINMAKDAQMNLLENGKHLLGLGIGEITGLLCTSKIRKGGEYRFTFILNSRIL
jgi:hypothetical protein